MLSPRRQRYATYNSIKGARCPKRVQGAVFRMEGRCVTAGMPHHRVTCAGPELQACLALAPGRKLPISLCTCCISRYTSHMVSGTCSRACWRHLRTPCPGSACSRNSAATFSNDQAASGQQMHISSSKIWTWVCACISDSSRCSRRCTSGESCLGLPTPAPSSLPALPLMGDSAAQQRAALAATLRCTLTSQVRSPLRSALSPRLPCAGGACSPDLG